MDFSEVPVMPSKIMEEASWLSRLFGFGRHVDVTYNAGTKTFKVRRGERTAKSEPFDDGESVVSEFRNGKRKNVGRWG